ALVACAVAVGVVELGGSGTRIADGAVRAYVALFAVAVAVELLATRRTWARVAIACAIAVAAVAAWRAPRLTLIVLAHLHGLGAVAWFARRAHARGVVVWPFVAAVALVLAGGALGAFDSLWAPTLWAPRSAAASIVAEAAGSAVDGAGAVLLRRALFLYAFGQALHFAIWLRLVPDVERAAKVPHSFRRALALFDAELGRWARPLLIACVVAAPLMLVGGGAAREAYFALTYFHVGLEAAALARA
ncbi:MAG: putative rane protein, partial [bacterium]|nr:putative rane protein [bacterium]